jgi:hypothetical protein
MIVVVGAEGGRQVSQEQQLLHDLLNDLTVINGHCSMMRDSVCEEANCRLKIILETSKSHGRTDT